MPRRIAEALAPAGSARLVAAAVSVLPELVDVDLDGLAQPRENGLA